MCLRWVNELISSLHLNIFPRNIQEYDVGYQNLLLLLSLQVLLSDLLLLSNFICFSDSF